MKILRNSEVFKRFDNNYWNYYLDIENDFLNTKKYVDFNEDNFNTFSLEYLKLYQAICGEIDVVGKVMAKYCNNNFDISKHGGIGSWWKDVNESYFLSESYFTPMNNTNQPRIFKITEYKCFMFEYIELHPWKDMSTISRTLNTPEWWRDYNKIKHRRAMLLDEDGKSYFCKANLGNLSNAIAGLYVLEKAFMDTVGTEIDLQAFKIIANYLLKKDF